MISHLFMPFSFYFLFIYLFLAALGLRCCMQAFSSCGERGLLFVVVHGLLIAVASLCCGARALGAWASVVVACGLSCSTACGIFQDQGLNLCPLHWQMDSSPLHHQGSPIFFFFFFFLLYEQKYTSQKRHEIYICIHRVIYKHFPTYLSK